MIEKLLLKMIEYYSGDPKRIQHFIKVHSFAKLIGKEENLDEKTLFMLETASIVHDIGIKAAEQRYGKCGGKLQEEEGPPLAEQMLLSLCFDENVIKRVCYLVGHHHTYTDIDGIDYQILVESDFIVNLYEDNSDESAVKNAYGKIFRTPYGKKILRDVFGISD